ncbi:His-Xaa-Ser repeat protein HxsA [Rubrivivax gelatinosus]|uniref:His-Xaa-Ser repeat protein HxsA n=1 Tax=Rubrivivax gelatinosus TaxID=28068 RepID=UPI000315C28F|nr:His-Xaa-Ser repeat protein HxsA [Rubrivivax gelatinosus]MBG6082537.1 His-Xaa-Ser repeat protein HxsA [Rubrivivax gelatinosus]
MSRFVKDIALFLAGVPLLLGRTGDSLAAAVPVTSDDASTVPLRPLNLEGANLFAGHRSHSSHSSHSSHASHSSHYSGSSGSYREPSTPSSSSGDSFAPTTPADTGTRYDNSVQPAQPRERKSAGSGSSLAPATPPTKTETPALSNPEKRRLQVMRVQIALRQLGLYGGVVDGELNADTRLGLQYFQNLKGLPRSGQMTTPTLNALGVPAVE